MSAVDYKKNAAKKADYQQRARDTLLRIENLITGKKQDQCFELIAEFIFLEKKPQDIRKPYGNQQPSNGLTLIQEFQLVVVLCEFFSRSSSDVTKNAIFLSLFGGSAMPYSRSRVLIKLISTAISGSIAPILRAAGTWMQQLGPTSAPCLDLANNLIQDFIIFSDKCSDQLRTLPLIASRFAINFMTASADLYLNDSKNNDYSRQVTVPPDMLLDVITEWVTNNPALCLATQPPLALPQGAISMPVVTPLAGLIRWCVLAPLFPPHESPSYSQLHLAILQSLLQASSSSTAANALNALHLGMIIITLKKKSQQIIDANGNPEQDAQYQCSIERFAQALQLALSAQTMSGNLPQLFSRLETLPRNPLLQIVIKSQRIN